MAEPADRSPQRRATWHDKEAVVCDDGPNTLVTSRNPDDLPAFDDEAIAAFAA